MFSFIISRLVILIFGTLYPAYASYKAVKTKDIKEYVKWMMYWIVFAFFTAGEIFLDVFLSFWFPFYYEIKILFVLWLLCPATKGSNFMYRKFVHPLLSKREKDIDDYLEKCKEDGYSAVLKLGSKAVTVATNTFIETAVRQIPLGNQWKFIQSQVLQPEIVPTKQVKSAADMYMPSRDSIRSFEDQLDLSPPRKDIQDGSEFLLSDDEIDMPIINKGLEEDVEYQPARRIPRGRRARSKSRSRKTKTVK